MRLSHLIQADTDLPTSYIYVTVPSEVREQLASIAPRLTEDDLHVTLLYLGKLDPELVPQAEKVLSEVAQKWQPLKAQLGGFGRFLKGPDGVPTFCTVDAPGLTHLQCDIERALQAAGISNGSEHGYLPHMTLSYEQEAKDVELPTVDELPKFQIASVGFDSPGRRRSFTLGGTVEDTREGTRGKRPFRAPQRSMAEKPYYLRMTAKFLQQVKPPFTGTKVQEFASRLPGQAESNLTGIAAVLDARGIEVEWGD